MSIQNYGQSIPQEKIRLQVPGAFAVVAGVRIDTRYDKTKESYLGVVSLVSV